MQRALGLALFALVFWTTEPVPIELSSLCLLALFPAAGLLSFEESFSPFAGKTLWLIFAGMALSLAIADTGLGERAATCILPHLARRPLLLIVQLHALGLAAAFLVPSGVVRVLLLMPIGTALGERFECARPEHLSTALLLSLVCSTLFGGFGILTGAVPNMVVAGLLEKSAGQTLYWSSWLAWMFPCIGLGRTLLSALVIWLMFGRRLGPLAVRRPAAARAEWPRAQKATFALLGIGVLLWAADALHQIAPVYIGLFLVLLLFLPRLGPLPPSALRQLNFPFLFYIAALFSLGAALDASGFSQFFIERASQRIDLAQWPWLPRHLALTLLALPLDFLMDIAAVAAIMTPPIIALAGAHGISPLAAALSTALATSLVFLPYQAAPFMIAYSYRRFSLAQLAAVQMAISSLSLLVFCPLSVLYWHWLGLV